MDKHQEWTPRIIEGRGMKVNWLWFLVLGLILIALGLIAVSSSLLTTLFSVFFLGILLMVSGVAHLIQSFGAQRWRGFLLSLFIGILYIVVGFLCAARPAESALSLTLLIAGLCLALGLCRMLASSLMRFEGWKWSFFNGLVTFLLGLSIWLGWPLSGLSTIGLFVGIDMVLSGWSWFMLALEMHKNNRHIPQS